MVRLYGTVICVFYDVLSFVEDIVNFIGKYFLVISGVWEFKEYFSFADLVSCLKTFFMYRAIDLYGKIVH